MAWTNFSKNATHYYNGAIGKDSTLRKYYVTFQYDDAVDTPTYVKCRIRCGNDVWKNGSGSDYFYIYFPNGVYTNTSKTAYTNNFLIHNGNTKVIPQDTGEFYLFKNWYDEGFTAPTFWICCQGRVGTLGTFYLPYFDGGNRKNFCTKVTSSLPYYDGWTPLSFGNYTGTIGVVDHKDNRVEIKGKTPYDRTWNATYPYPNKVTSASVEYYIDSRYGGSIPLKLNNYNNQSYSTLVSIPAGGTPNPTIKASLLCTGTYDNPIKAETTGGVKVYTNPRPFRNDNKPEIQTYSDAGVNKSSKLTPNGWVKLKWPIGEGGNSNSPVNGCRIYIGIKKSTANSWTTISTRSSGYEDVWYVTQDEKRTNINYYDIPLNGKTCRVNINHSDKTCYALISCKDLGLEKGDEFKFWIEPWHWHTSSLNNDVNGYNRWWITLIRDNDNGTSETFSVGSSGIMSVYLNGGWKQGQVYTYINDEWKKSVGVFVWDGTRWRKSV